MPDWCFEQIDTTRCYRVVEVDKAVANESNALNQNYTECAVRVVEVDIAFFDSLVR